MSDLKFYPLTAQDVLGISAALSITRKQGEMVALLLVKQVLTADMAEALLGLKSDFKVLMCRLNKRLAHPHGIATRTHYGVGYSFSPEQREKIIEIVLEKSGSATDLKKSARTA